jgi:adenylate kinase
MACRKGDKLKARLRQLPGVQKLVGVTGSPGTGKKTVAPILAKLLDAPLVDLNALAKRMATPSRGEYQVDVGLLRQRLKALNPAGSVVFGHLLSDVLRRSEVAFVAVLRCEPSALKSRLESRGYERQKVTENVEAELIGVVLDSSVRRFGEDRVREYDTTSTSPAALARRMAGDYKRGRGATAPWIDWTLDYDSPSKLRSLFSPGTAGDAAST